MSHIDIALSALVTLGLAIMIAPGILRMNRGKILRNIALWLAIFAGLALAYKHIGPGATGLQTVDRAPSAATSQEEDPTPGTIDLPANRDRRDDENAL